MIRLRGNSHLVWLGLALAVVVAEAAAYHRAWSNFERSKAQFDHTREVLAAVDELTSAVRDAETGQRGYIITGREQYLQPFRDAIGTIPGRLDLLRRLTMDNPRQRSRVAALGPPVEDKLAELLYTVGLRQQDGFARAAKVIETDRGLRAMGTIRTLAAEIKHEENHLLEDRTAETEFAARQTFGIVAASSV